VHVLLTLADMLKENEKKNCIYIRELITNNSEINWYNNFEILIRDSRPIQWKKLTCFFKKGNDLYKEFF